MSDDCAQIGYGIDVSHWQNPETLPWESFRGRVDFVMVRACYGTRLDERAKGHVEHARGIEAKVGIYSFFLASQPASDQFIALERMAETCGIGSGDVVPALDIEDEDKDHPVTPAWSDACERIVELSDRFFGSTLVYITQRGWSMLGKPEWVLHHPLWVANYGVTKPATPAGMPATIWQHRVDIFDPAGPSTCPRPPPPGAIDQSRLMQPLPLVGYHPTFEERQRIAALVTETLRAGVQSADTDPCPQWEDPEESIQS